MALSPISSNLGLSDNSFSNENPASIYAKEGEPIYLKEMDYDEDGKVTFEEFREYCKDNELSSYEIKKLLEAQSAWKLMQAQKETKEEEGEQQESFSINSDEYLNYYNEQASKQDLNAETEAYVDIEA